MEHLGEGGEEGGGTKREPKGRLREGIGFGADLRSWQTMLKKERLRRERVMEQRTRDVRQGRRIGDGRNVVRSEGG